MGGEGGAAEGYECRGRRDVKTAATPQKRVCSFDQAIPKENGEPWPSNGRRVYPAGRERGSRPTAVFGGRGAKLLPGEYKRGSFGDGMSKGGIHREVPGWKGVRVIVRNRRDVGQLPTASAGCVSRLVEPSSSEYPGYTVSSPAEPEMMY